MTAFPAAGAGAPEPPVLHPVDRYFVREGRRKLLYFGGCDYFRLSWDAGVRLAVARAARDLGHNVAASRRTSGTHRLHLELESALAVQFGFEAAVLTSCGYLAPLAAVQGLAERHTDVLVDSGSHSCLHDAARVSGLPAASFAHGDATALRRSIGRLGRRSRALVLCDGLSPHLGTAFPVGDYLAVLPANATLLVDDAHGCFVLGRRGRGVLEHLGIDDPRVVLTATLSKALGACGGAILAPERLARCIVKSSGAYAGSTPLSPALAAGALASLAVLRRRGAELRRRLQANAAAFRSPQNVTGVPAREHIGPMFSLAPRSARAARALAQRLRQAGIYPTLIRYRGGPSEAFFRFAVSPAHTAAQIESLRSVLVAPAPDDQSATSSK